MSFIIKRSFSPEYASLLRRPRVSHKVSEYIFDFVNENLLKPSKVLQSDKYIYEFTFHFTFSIPKRQFPYTSPFATDTRLYFSQRGFRTFEKINKWVTVIVLADDIDEKIEPFEYATIILKMLADFLLNEYKKFDKKTFDSLIEKLDRNYIESFPFPASVDEQYYSLDDINYPVVPLEYGHSYVGLDKLVTINPRTEYLKHYTF
jgi:hypothetical protein